MFLNEIDVLIDIFLDYMQKKLKNLKTKSIQNMTLRELIGFPRRRKPPL